MLVESHKARSTGAATALVLGSLFAGEAHALGFSDSHSGFPTIVIQVSDHGGTASDGSASSGQGADADGDSGIDPGVDAGAATDAGVGVDADAGTDTSVEADTSVGADAEVGGVDVDTSDTDTPDVTDGSTDGDDADASIDTSVDASAGNADTTTSGSEEDDTGSSQASRGASPSGTSTSANTSPSRAAMKTADAARAAADAAEDNTASAAVREAPSASVRSLFGSEAHMPAANAQPMPACIDGDADCKSREGPVERAPSSIGEPGKAITGVSQPRRAPSPEPAAIPNRQALALSLVDPIKARDGLVVQGIVFNSSGRLQAVPPLRISLKDEAGQTLQRWTMRPPVGQLPPGEHKAFKTILQPIPRTVARVDAAFLAVSP